MNNMKNVSTLLERYCMRKAWNKIGEEFSLTTFEYPIGTWIYYFWNSENERIQFEKLLVDSGRGYTRIDSHDPFHKLTSIRYTFHPTDAEMFLRGIDAPIEAQM